MIKKGILLTVIIAVLVLGGLPAVFMLSVPVPDTPSADEISLHIQLDTREDIGLLLIAYTDQDGSGGQGGMSNADGTLMGHDEQLFYTVPKDAFEKPSELTDLTVRFTVVSEYVKPNYEDIYPEALQIPLAPITFKAAFGGTYEITVSGDRETGYTAMLG